MGGGGGRGRGGGGGGGPGGGGVGFPGGGFKGAPSTAEAVSACASESDESLLSDLVADFVAEEGSCPLSLLLESPLLVDSGEESETLTLKTSPSASIENAS